LQWAADLVFALAILSLPVLLVVACDQPVPEPARVPEPPEPDMTDMEPLVEQRLRETREAVLADPQSAEAWGRFGMVAHAHNLLEEALPAYRQAQELDPTDVRWPYYLAEVLSVLGTDLEEAERALRRTLRLRPGYAPAHMRLGNVLLARDQVEAAAAELERALELEPTLQPNRVALAQVRLSQGELEAAEQLLLDVLAGAPRHSQALSTLGQVYMRQGKREEAREIAARARSAARYNLYSDPLMGEVDSEARSSVVLWERARAFFENGNYEQAARGLRLVVELQPSNADAHLQLAIAYGNLGDLQRARYHLESTVTLDPDYVEPRIRLAMVYLDQENPEAAVEHLRKALELAPDDPDAGWLLGKALVLTGDLHGGLATYEQAKAAGLDVPNWAHNEWGNALAQAGQSDAALAHFQAVLEADPDNAQALFYTGLVLEGLGRIEEALESYCRSMSAEPNPPATARLEALGGDCD
jgi:tetratricopeptide (TPR) repeat protein